MKIIELDKIASTELLVVKDVETKKKQQRNSFMNS